MQVVELKRKQLDLSEFVKRTALVEDAPVIIKEDSLLLVDGAPAILYQRVDWDFSKLRGILDAIEYQESTRTGGLKTTSRVFGFQPRIALRRDFCTATSLAGQHPEANALICDYGKRIEELYQRNFPRTHAEHQKLALDKILPEWRCSDTCFSSGIINKNNPLKYHYDAGNFPNVCSCMLGFKRDTAGGYLALPEFGVALEIADRSLSIFDGQKILHGVTPITKLTPRAHRYTIVYYTLKGMWHCEPLTEELARFRQVRTQREFKRAGLLDEAVVDQHGEQEGT